MHLVAIAWLYVALMMALAEALHSQGTVLGAIVTFFLYGVGPLSLVLYLMGSPARRRAARRRDAQADEVANAGSSQPDQGRHATGATERDMVTPVGEER